MNGPATPAQWDSLTDNASFPDQQWCTQRVRILYVHGRGLARVTHHGEPVTLKVKLIDANGSYVTQTMHRAHDAR